MKKIILFLSLSAFLLVGFVTVTKTLKANASKTELIFVDSKDISSTFAAPDVQDDGKKKKSKDAKVTKDDCKKVKCSEAKSCDKKSKKGCCSKEKKDTKSVDKDKDGK
nr:hypothetical protein [Bacteroidota bacterium]